MAHHYSSQYAYTRIGTPENIRVLILEPTRDPDAPLRFSFLQDTLVNLKGRYEAISYTWGEPKFTYPLYSQDGSQVFVTRHLGTALRTFRGAHKPRSLWVDAVCINQADNEEKAFQIPLMVRIFRGALRVLAWLGTGGEEEEGMRVLERWSRRWRDPLHQQNDHNDDSNTKSDSTESDDEAYSSGSHSGYSSEDANNQNGVTRIFPKSATPLHLHSKHPDVLAVTRFLDLPWFTRIWIIQEVVFNLDVSLIYGDMELSWIRLMNGFFYQRRAFRHHPRVQYIVTKIRMWKLRCGLDTTDDTRGEPGIFELLRKTETHRYTDGRDRILGLYSMAKDLVPTESKGHSQYETQIRMDIDYSLDVRQTYQAFAKACVHATRNNGTEQVRCEDTTYKMLSATLARRSFIIPDGWPSWVPDWRNPPRLNGWMPYEGEVYIHDKAFKDQLRASIYCTWWDPSRRTIDTREPLFPPPEDDEPFQAIYLWNPLYVDGELSRDIPIDFLFRHEEDSVDLGEKIWGWDCKEGEAPCPIEPWKRLPTVLAKYQHYPGSENALSAIQRIFRSAYPGDSHDGLKSLQTLNYMFKQVLPNQESPFFYPMGRHLVEGWNDIEPLTPTLEDEQLNRLVLSS